jgi:hypothetical protein
MTEIILSALLITSLATTGALFLKWWDAKKTIAQLKTENDELKTSVRDSQRQHIEKMTNIQKTYLEEIKQVLTQNNELQSKIGKYESKVIHNYPDLSRKKEFITRYGKH